MTSHSDLVTVDELTLLMESGKCCVVDCRFDLFDESKGYADYLDGHIPSAVYADLNKDLAGEITAYSGRHPLPAPDDFVQTLQGWGVNKETLVVAYDYGNGALAARLWWMLRFWLGHRGAAVLDGGLNAWSSNGGKLQQALLSRTKGNFVAVANDSATSTVSEIWNGLGTSGEIHLVDAREPARYYGEVEPIDVVAGHIPGARNLPLATSLDETGRWLSQIDLKLVWEEFLGGGPEGSPVVMCGSGVTACHLILSAVLAGYEPPRLYVGSWSEWIRDPARAIASNNDDIFPV